MKRSYFYLMILVLLAILLGFVQENIKVNVNYLLEKGEKIPGFFQVDAKTKTTMLEQVKIDAPFDYYHNHQRQEWLLNLSHTQLSSFKWLITVVFIVVFMTINAWIMKIFTGEKVFVKRTIGIYVVFFLLAVFIFLLGKITGTSDRAYGVSREIVGGLQSLVPLMLMIPAYWLLKNQHIVFQDEKSK